MPGTRRIPLARRPTTVVTPRATELFAAMGKLRCVCCNGHSSCPACDEWWRLHAELHAELNLKPHEWPAVARQSPKGAGPPINDDTAARMALLAGAHGMNGARA